MKPRRSWRYVILSLALGAGEGAVAQSAGVRASPKSEARLATASFPVPPQRPAAPETCESTVRDATAVGALVLRISQEEQVDPGLAEAIAGIEAGMGPSLASKAGAIGIMQLMPATGAADGATQRCDAEANIRAGLGYLRDLIDAFGDPGLAHAAYNAGPSAVHRHRGIPIQAETVAYIARVLNHWRGDDRTLAKTRPAPIERSRTDRGTGAVRLVPERPHGTGEIHKPKPPHPERWVDAHVFIME